MFLFRRDDNVLDIFLEPNERAGFQIVIPAVCHQIFNELPGAGVLLYFIKNNQGFSLVQRCRIEGGQFCKKEIQIRTVINEKIKDILRCITKINRNMGAVFIGCKLLGNIALSYAPGSIESSALLPLLFCFQETKRS